MIAGTVSSDRQATICLKVNGPMGQELEIVAIIDTGFNGFLTVPTVLVSQLGLQRIGRGRVVLADGSEQIVDISAITVMWDGLPLIIEADAADCEPLVGMALLEGYELRIQAIPGGNVFIERLP